MKSTNITSIQSKRLFFIPNRIDFRHFSSECNSRKNNIQNILNAQLNQELDKLRQDFDNNHVIYRHSSYFKTMKSPHFISVDMKNYIKSFSFLAGQIYGSFQTLEETKLKSGEERIESQDKALPQILKDYDNTFCNYLVSFNDNILFMNLLNSINGQVRLQIKYQFLCLSSSCLLTLVGVPWIASVPTGILGSFFGLIFLHRKLSKIYRGFLLDLSRLHYTLISKLKTEFTKMITK